MKIQIIFDTWDELERWRSGDAAPKATAEDPKTMTSHEGQSAPPEAFPLDEAPAYSIGKLQAMAKVVTRADRENRQAIKDLITRCGADRISEITPDRFGDFADGLRAIDPEIQI